jgi:hypothetical protein
MAAEYFGHLPDHHLTICRTCRYVVFPDQAVTHLREKHAYIRPSERSVIVAELRAWPALYASTEDFILPTTINSPLLGLPVYRDGLLC